VTTVNAGFTIAETMIVLAVTGLLFASTALLVVGRQNKVEFQTAVNDFQQQLQQIINETSSGYFPNGGGFSCNASSVNHVVTFSSAGSAQGTNSGCIFLGKVIQFGLGTTSPENSQIAVFPVVGAQYYNDPFSGATAPVATLGQAIPRVAWPESGDSLNATATSSLENLTQTYSLQYGLSFATTNSACSTAFTGTGSNGYYEPARLARTPPLSGTPPICYVDPNNVYSNSKVETGTATFLFSDSSGDIASANGDNLQSGSQELSLYAAGPSPGSGLGGTSSSVDDWLGVVPAHVGNLPSYSPSIGSVGALKTASELLVCMASGSTNQSALFTIGNSSAANMTGGGLGVSYQIMGDQTC